jgi:hypothetical protein
VATTLLPVPPFPLAMERTRESFFWGGRARSPAWRKRAPKRARLQVVPFSMGAIAVRLEMRIRMKGGEAYGRGVARARDRA